MTGEHFTEYIETVAMTTGTSVRQIINYLGFTETQIYKYKKQGVSVKKSGLVCNRFRDFCMEFKDKKFEPVFIPRYKKIVAS
jgi:hypothetical protein